MTDELAWDREQTELEYDCPGFGVRRDDATLPDGTAASYHYVDEPPAVVVLPFTPEGSVVVIEEWRQPVRRVNRGVPAGTMEPVESGPPSWERDGEVAFESIEAAARRELQEETGYEADTIEPLVTVEPVNGVSNAVHHHVVARGCEPSGGQNLDDDETIRVRLLGYDELREQVRDGTIRDGRAVTAVAQYELRE